MPIGEKRKALRRVALGLVTLGVLWLFSVWPPPMWWRAHWPMQTAMMRLRDSAISYQPSALSQFPPVLQRMVIIGEDSRFRSHHGLDLEEIRDALGLHPGAGVGRTIGTLWKRRGRLRGASTITQQLAKNLYLSPSRNPLRKLKEAITALRLELNLPKDRILELYLSVVELGPGVWGMAPASARYFGAKPSSLTEAQAAALAATLPFPLTSNPAYRSARMLHRRDLILARYHGVDVYIPPEEELLDSLPVPTFTPPIVPPMIDSLMGDSIVVPPPDSIGDTGKDSGP
jgi:monofunctional biosynthetic peptidoglycan transglycosylase